ncbi:hypothetical protein EVAR_82992_1 [Eumeta japonica]|uniref:Uncharacterized protein n=1 Tax=Eumeta variegata TaxID=151549 RepID=A0A4C1VRL1_EUMVA|nr:hypothetical protein EVAR_82992_1 [Eumeta japonica]
MDSERVEHIDSLSIYTSDIGISFFQEKSVTADFLGVSSAYDNIQFPILRNKLHKLKTPMRLKLSASKSNLVVLTKEENGARYGCYPRKRQDFL